MFSYDEIIHGQVIYKKLNQDKTKSGNVVIKKVFGKSGIVYSKTIFGLFSLRLSHTEYHFGNPFSSVKSVLRNDKSIIECKNTKESVEMYITWILYSCDKRATWIRQILNKGVLKNKLIVYYKELNQPSHANALDFLINNWDNEYGSL